ncbi:MAG TPA: tyrosine-protein phosphatase [Microbacterium sp.]|uniref:tyrosine-protein phosphatase n=1 Tax=Microbacterium sp. TaxID=51671 RepID=UPI002B499DB2|nr:tyrosine-protein phosphatase [Microbacterium sp.]HKT55250.1 tyrosine-protein phosphatase [Microbacterium sp.]
MPALIDGTFNSREVAGLPLASGGVVAGGVLYRSDALAAVTDAGAATIAHSLIGTVVDFRADAEREQAPDRLPEHVDVVRFPMLDGAVRDSGRAERAVPSLAAVYAHLLDTHGADFAAVGRLVARPADPARPAVLVHCTAGKDRTGVAVALVLDAVGTARDAIVTDYLATAANLAGAWADGMRRRIEAAGMPLTPELDELLAGTTRPAIESVFAHVDAGGGAAEYLLRHGLSAPDLDALRSRLTSPGR